MLIKSESMDKIKSAYPFPGLVSDEQFQKDYDCYLHQKERAKIMAHQFEMVKAQAKEKEIAARAAAIQCAKDCGFL